MEAKDSFKELETKMEINLNEYKQVLSNLDYIYVEIPLDEDNFRDIIIPKSELENFRNIKHIYNIEVPEIIDASVIGESSNYQYGADIEQVYKQLGYKIPLTNNLGYILSGSRIKYFEMKWK